MRTHGDSVCRAWVPALVAAALLSHGCATKIYQGPTSGRGAEAQQAVVMSAERALSRYDASRLRGKAVVIEVYGLAPRLEGESPEEGLIRSMLTERLLRGGAYVVGHREDADVVVLATLRTAGVDVIRRDFPMIYHHTTFRGLTSVRVSAMRLQRGDAVKVLDQKLFEAESIYREIYIFYVFGPITSRSTRLTAGVGD
ncbi:hypothetical protein ACFL59_02290 [Planctomycetota bacterium]